MPPPERHAPLDAGGLGGGLAITLLAASYFVFGKLGLRLASVNPSATAVWPPTGISLAALLLWGPRVWPGVFLGAWLVNITTSGSVGVSLAVAAGNTLEGLIGAYLVARFAGGREVFQRASDLLKFTVLAALLGTVASATIGAVALSAGGLSAWPDFSRVWVVWWLGDAVGAVLVTPVILLWASEPSIHWKARKAAEAVLLLAGAVLVAQAAFGGRLPGVGRNDPLDFIATPILLWAAFRFGPRETATVCALFSTLALRGMLRGFGPFAGIEPNKALLLLQAFLGTMTVTALALAAMAGQHRRAEASLSAANASLESRDARRSRELLLKTEELSRVNAELAQFAGIAAHELQEPLRKILAFGRLLTTSGREPPPDVRDYVRKMEDSAGRMQRLVDDILGLSRVTTNAQPLAPVDLGEVAREVARDFEGRIGGAGGRVEVGRLPTIQADAGQMRRLFENLVSNAYKFRRPAESPRIAISAGEAQRGFVAVQVSDNGIGFDEKYLGRLFQPFQRLNRKTDYEGSGMGLAICRRILLRHGGEITAQSEPGKGSTFIFTLPAFHDAGTGGDR